MDGSFFVTTGLRHVKFWYLNDVPGKRGVVSWTDRVDFTAFYSVSTSKNDSVYPPSHSRAVVRRSKSWRVDLDSLVNIGTVTLWMPCVARMDDGPTRSPPVASFAFSTKDGSWKSGSMFKLVERILSISPTRLLSVHAQTGSSGTCVYPRDDFSLDRVLSLNNLAFLLPK